MTQPDDDEAIHAPARLEALVIDRDPAVRAWALTRLGEVAPAGAGRAALMALGDDDPTVQSAALGVLEQVQPEGMRAALRSYSGRRGVWPGLKARARRLAEVKGSTPPLADQALVSAPAEIPPDQLLARLEAAVATDREPVEESATEDVEALLQRHPASLRAIAPAILARGDEDDRRVPVIVALGRQRQRWATRLLLEHLDALLATREEALVWEAFGDLGDPAALEALIAAWREGERTGARAIAQIARIADRYDALPSPLRAEAEAQRTLSAQMEKHIADGQRAGQLDALLGDRDLFLRLRCLRCQRTFGYEVPQALLHPDPDACHSDGWDGVYLLRIIRCKGCGAVDQYELTTQALLVLMGGTAAHGGRVTIGQAQVLEGKFIRRASEGLRLVRAETERHPDSAEAWLRLGNLCRRLAEPAEMERAFRRSKELAPNGLDAVVTLADVLWGQGRWSEATAEIQESVARLAKCDRGQSRDEIASLFDLIAETLRGNSGSLALRVGWMVPGTSSDRPTMSLSSIDLRRVSRWEDLCDFLVEADLITTGLTTEVPNPADGPTQIEVALGRRAFGAKRTPKGVATSGSPIASLPRRTGARVGRNAPCPCGSGKKYKKCCGG